MSEQEIRNRDLTTFETSDVRIGDVVTYEWRGGVHRATIISIHSDRGGRRYFRCDDGSSHDLDDRNRVPQLFTVSR